MAEQRESKLEETADDKLPSIRAIGWIVVLLILAGYFMWMIIEMGAAAVSGSAPMFAFLIAAAIGIAAAGAALALGKRS
jgi:hypothetical protein